MQTVLQIVISLIVMLLAALVAYARLSRIFPGPARRLALVAAWIATNIFPSFWHLLGRPVTALRARYVNFWTADPGVKRGETEQPESLLPPD